jgi:hypothetical protein
MGPPTDDPRKLLYAAARWMTAAGWAYATLGLLLIFLGLRAWQVALTGGCLLASGVMFLISGPFARRHRGWAVWLGIGTSVLLAVALALLLMLLAVHVGWHDLVRIRWFTRTATALLLLVCIVVHVMIVWNLSHSLDAVGAPQGVAAESGFEPVVPAAPRPVLPVESGDAPTAARSGGTGGTK